MKRTITILTICLLTLIINTSCFKPDHQIRVKNNVGEEISSLQIGPIYFGSLYDGEITPYHHMETGSYSISGTYTTTSYYSSYTYDLYGSISLSGNGKHNWTITIGSSGYASISEDK